MEKQSVRLVDSQTEADIFNEGYKKGLREGENNGWHKATKYYVTIIDELQKKIERLRRSVG